MKYFILLIQACLVLCLLTTSVLGREVRDSMDTKVTLVERPQRIVTLAPSLGELVADLVGQDLNRIVGVSEFTDYPPKLKSVPSIGPYHQFNLEKVVSLKPDLVLATRDGNPEDRVKQLRELGIPVVVVKTTHFQEVTDSIQLVADSIGNPSAGHQMVSQLKTGIQRIRERSQAHAPLKVMLQVGDNPLIVVGGKSFIQSAVETLGVVNIYSDAQAHYPKPSIEDVIKKDPDVIIVIALGNDLEEFQRMARKWNQFPQLKAVKNQRVQVLKNDALLRPTLRLLEGLSILDRTLYGKK